MTKKLIPVNSIDEFEAVGDLNIKKGRYRFGQGLGWHRGKQAGLHSAYLTLKKYYPEAAKALIDAWGMDENGDIHL